MLGLEFPAIPFRTLRMDWFFRNWTVELQGSLYECWIPSLKLVKIGKLCPQKDRSPPIPPGFAGVNCCLFALRKCVKNSSGRRCRKRYPKKHQNSASFWCFQQRPASRGHVCFFWNRLKSLLLILLKKKKQRGWWKFQWIFTGFSHLMHDVDGQLEDESVIWKMSWLSPSLMEGSLRPRIFVGWPSWPTKNPLYNSLVIIGTWWARIYLQHITTCNMWHSNQIKKM